MLQKYVQYLKYRKNVDEEQNIKDERYRSFGCTIKMRIIFILEI